MTRRVFLSSLTVLVFVLFQTTLLKFVAVLGVTPDLAMLVMIFIAHRNGSMTGQISGFTTGVVEDLLSLSPLGFHTLLKTVIGFLYGTTSGRMFIDPILMPVIFAVVATLLKVILSASLAFLFSLQTSGEIISVSLWVELGMNSILAPFVYALVGALRFLNPIRGEAR